MKPKIVTIGAYGFDKESFFQALLDAKVDTFCDLRMRRGMRGSTYAFVNSSSLQSRLGELGYISRSTGIPKSSTGYWLPNRPLTLTYRYEKPYYQIKYDIYNDYQGTLSIPYVGFADPIQQIPVSALIRISLARWWIPTGINEERCYLQLSGWYL
jgi:putative nucleic acid modification protein with dual OB domain